MIQSCDYDWISIFHVMDSMYSVWGSLELASKCQKPVVVTLLVWRLVAWGVLPGDKGKPEKLKTHGTWWKNVIPPIGKDLVEALESTWRLAVRSVLPSDNCRHGHQRRVCAWRYASPAKRFGSGQHLAECVPRKVILLLQL